MSWKPKNLSWWSCVGFDRLLQFQKEESDIVIEAQDGHICCFYLEFLFWDCRSFTCRCRREDRETHVASPTFPQCWHPAAEAQPSWSLPSALKQDVWFEDEFHKVSWALLGEIYKAKINNESGEGAKSVCWTDGGWAFQGKDCFRCWFSYRIWMTAARGRQGNQTFWVTSFRS